MSWILLLALMLVVFVVLIGLKNRSGGATGAIGFPYQATKTLFSAAERSFLGVLDQAVGWQDGKRFTYTKAAVTWPADARAAFRLTACLGFRDVPDAGTSCGPWSVVIRPRENWGQSALLSKAGQVYFLELKDGVVP